ncbi:MAG: hypothetical protein JO287_10725, partial [Pseudonocardiales bacterium]|nr:hypothetical protein [Pseudonocardiales bacterium]
MMILVDSDDPGCGVERNSITMTAVPTLTAEQRQQALRHATAACPARKRLLQAVARGQESVPAVLERAKTDTIVGRTKVTALLTTRRWLLRRGRWRCAVAERRRSWSGA